MRTAIIIPIFERPDELYLCLESIKRTVDLRDTFFVLIDDCSKNERTNELFEKFFINTVPMCKIRNEVNYKIAINIKKGVGKAAAMGAELFVILDSDVIVHPNWLERIKDLKKRFPCNIISGFNTLTKSRTGHTRHPIISEGTDFYIKHSIGGANMAFDFEQYRKFINVGINNSIALKGHWDTLSCKAIVSDGAEIIVTKPSVIEHIARTSTLSHTDNPDRSADWQWEASGIFSERNVFPIKKQQHRSVSTIRKGVFRR